MKVLLEVTEWEDNTPNHLYLISDSGKVLAYAPENCNWRIMRTPMRFDRKYRKFKQMKDIPIPRAISS